MGAFDRAAPVLVQNNPLDSFGQPGELVKGLRRGITGTTAGLQAAAGQVVQPMSPELGTAIIQDAIAAEHASQQRNAPRVGTWKDAQLSGANFADYLLAKGSEAVPALPVAMVGGVAGKLAGLGGAVGGAAAFQPVMMGSEAMRLQNDPAAADLTPGQKLLHAGGFGAAEAAAMGAVPGMMGSRLLSRAPVTSFGGAASKALLDTGVNSVGMGAGMAAGDVIGQLGQRTYNPNAVYDPEATKEAFVGGVAAGLPLAGPHAALARGLDVAKAGAVDAPLEATRSALTRVRERLPDAVRPFADAIIGGGEVTTDAVNALAPYADILGIGAKTVFNRVSEAAKNAGQNIADAHNASLLTPSDVVAGATDVGAALVGGIEGTAPDMIKALKAQAAADGVKLDFSADKSDAENLNALSDYMKKYHPSAAKPLARPGFQQQMAGMVRKSLGNDLSLDETGQLKSLLDKVDAGQELSPAESAQLWSATSTLSGKVANRERFSKDLAELADWQEKTGKTAPTAEDTGLKFSKQKVKDQARESARDVFGSAQMREALAELQVAPEVIDGVLDRIQAKDIKERGVELVIRRAVTSALTKRGMKDFARRGAPVYDLMTTALREKLAEKFPRKQKENAPAEWEQSPEFERGVDNIVGELITASDKPELKNPENMLDASYGIADFINKLSSGKADYARRADQFRSFLTRNFGDNASWAADRIIKLAETEYAGQPERVERLKALRESQDTLDAVTAELKKTAGYGGAKMADHMISEYRKARAVDEQAKDFSKYYNGAKRLREVAAQLEEHSINAVNPERAQSALEKADKLRTRADELEAQAGEASKGGSALAQLRARWIGSELIKAKNDEGQRGDVFDRVAKLVEKYERANNARTDREKAQREQRSGSMELADDMDLESYIRKITRDEDGNSNGVDNETGRQGEEGGAKWYGTDILHTEARGKLTKNGRSASVNKTETGAFLSSHPSMVYADEHGNPRSPLAMARDLLYENEVGHRVATVRTKTPEQWVNEVGGNPHEMLKQAMADVVAHDKRMLKDYAGKLGAKEAEAMKKRIELFESGATGVEFFNSPWAKKMRMLKVEQNAGDTMALDEQEIVSSSVRNFNTHETGESAAAYAARMQRQEGSFKTTAPYEKALFPVELMDKGKPMLNPEGKPVVMQLDFAKLVQRVLREHQSGDTAGVSPESFMEKLKNTVHEVVGALLASDSVNAEAFKKAMRKTNEGELLPLDLVAYRSKGEGARSFTYGQVAGIKEITKAGDVVRKNIELVETPRSGKERAAKGSNEMVTNEAVKGIPFTDRKAVTDIPDQRTVDSYVTRSTPAAKSASTARAVAEKGGVTYDINLNRLLVETLHANEIDGQKHVQEGDLPTKLAAKMLQEGLANLEHLGYKIDRSKLADVEVYRKQYGDKTEPVLQKKLNAEVGDVPRDIEGAKAQETRDLIESYRGKIEKTLGDLDLANEQLGSKLGGRDELLEKQDALLEAQVKEARQMLADMKRQGFVDLSVGDHLSLDRGVRVNEGRKTADEAGVGEMEALRIKENFKEFGGKQNAPVFDVAEAYGSKRQGSTEPPKRDIPETVETLKQRVEETRAAMEEALRQIEAGVEPKVPATDDINAAKNRAAEAELKEAPVVAAKTKVAREQKSEHAERKAQARLLNDERNARKINADLDRRMSANESDAVTDLVMELDGAEKPMAPRVLADKLAGMTPEQRSTLRATLENSESVAAKAATKMIDAKYPVGARGEDTPFSKQTPQGVREAADAMQAEHGRLVGAMKAVVETVEGLKLGDKEITGQYSKATKEAVAKIVMNAAAGMEGVHHETWHHIEALLDGMGEHGKHIKDIVYKAMEAEHVKQWLAEKFAGDEGALSQLESPSERAAFAFQRFMAGDKLPLAPKARSVWQKLADWVRNLVGLTSSEDKARNFFEYIKEEGFARDVENPEALIRGIKETRMDNMLKGAKKTLKPFGEVLDKLIEHGDNRVRKHGVKSYEALMNKYVGETGKGGYQSAKHQQYYKWGNQFAQFFEKNKDADYTHPGWDAMQTSFENYMRNAGVSDAQIKSLRNNLDGYNKIEADSRFEELVADIANHGGLPKTRGISARDVATQIVDRGYFYDPDFKLFDGAPRVAAKWMAKNPVDKAIAYATKGTELAERTRAFGEVTKETPYGKEFHELLKKGDTEATKEAQQDMQEFIKGWEHTYENSMSPGLKKVIGSIQLFENARLLPLAVFSQALEPMQLALRRNSFEGIGGSLWRGIKNLPRAFDTLDAKYTPDYWEKFAMNLGTAQHRILDGAVGRMVNGMRLPGWVGEINDKFFQYNFMNTWNRSMHIEATKHAVEFLKEHARGANKVHSDRFLNELHINRDEVLKNIIREGEIESLKLTPNIERAICQWVNEAMAHADAGSNPFWMNDPRFALISQMKRFTFSHSKYMLDRGIREWQLGNTWVAAPAVLAMPWMLASDAVRDTLTGKDMAYRANWGVSDYAMHAYERAGHTGISQFGADAWRDVKVGGSGLGSLLGPAAQSFGDTLRGANTGHMIDALIGNSPSGRLLGV